MLKNSLTRRKNSKLASNNNLKNSLTSANIDEMQELNFRSSKIMSENDLLTCTENRQFFQKNATSKSDMELNDPVVPTATAQLNHNTYGIYFSDNVLDKDKDESARLNDIDFNCNIDNRHQPTSVSTVSDVNGFRNRNNSLNIVNQSASSTFLPKDRYFQRLKSKRRSASSYIYERRNTSTKSILNQIEYLQPRLQINGI